MTRKQAPTANRIILNSDLTGFDSASRITEDHRKIMRNYASPLLSGPAPTDLLLEMIAHMFTEEEAAIAAHLPPLRPRTAQKVAEKTGRSVNEVKGILDHLSFRKAIILASGTPSKYAIMPIVPGTFEMALMTKDLSTRNEWHKKFAQYFEKLWETGYIADYKRYSKALVRYVPVQSLTGSLQSAWPSDYLDEILSRYDDFAVTHCQCRLAMELSDKGCGKPLEACASFGPLVKPLLERGLARRVDKAEMLAIKKNAEENGCVTWLMNAAGDPKGDCSCSCCGCCCHALRSVTQYNVPGMIATPHFMPEKAEEKCKRCGLCVKACPMNAWTANPDKTVSFDRKRCIGCGLCVVSCKPGALSLSPIGKVKPPEENYLSLLLKLFPGFAANSVSVFAKRILKL